MQSGRVLKRSVSKVKINNYIKKTLFGNFAVAFYLHLIVIQKTPQKTKNPTNHNHRNNRVFFIITQQRCTNCFNADFTNNRAYNKYSVSYYIKKSLSSSSLTQFRTVWKRMEETEITRPIIFPSILLKTVNI